MVKKRWVWEFDFSQILCKVLFNTMPNITKSAVVALLLAMATFTLPLRAAKKSDPADQGQVALAVANWLQQAHYTRQPLDKEMSAKLAPDLGSQGHLRSGNFCHYVMVEADSHLKPLPTSILDM